MARNSMKRSANFDHARMLEQSRDVEESLFSRYTQIDEASTSRYKWGTIPLMIESTKRKIGLKDIHTLVFDFDGTLATCPYDFARMRRSISDIAHEYGLDTEPITKAGLLEGIEIGTKMLASFPIRARAFKEAATASLSALEWEAAAVTELLPGVIDALRALHAAGFKSGIITRNSANAVARIIGDNILPVEDILCREDVRQPKPHPEHVLTMLEVLKSSPEKSMMVGDHPMDIQTGKAAGMVTAGVLTGQTDEGTLLSSNPDYLFPTVVELTKQLLASRKLTGFYE